MKTLHESALAITLYISIYIKILEPYFLSLTIGTGSEFKHYYGRQTEGEVINDI